MQEPLSILIDQDEIEWDEDNLSHAARHDVTPVVVQELLAGMPLFRANLDDRAGDYQMIGPDASGRFWTIILHSRGEGRWRPITGWPSDSKERGWYTRFATNLTSRDG